MEGENTNPSESAPVAITPEELQSVVRAAVEQATADVRTSVLDEFRRSASPDVFRGITNGNVSAPALAIRSLEANPYAAHTDDFRGLAFARAVRIHANARMTSRSIREVTEEFEKASGIPTSSPVNNAVRAALNISELANGGALASETYGEFIELLRANTVIRKAGVRQLPMPASTVRMRRQTGATTAHYVGEKPSGDKTSRIATGLETIVPKKLMATSVLSNDLLRDPTAGADLLTRDDMIQVASLREDLAFIRGDGTENTPKGIRYWTATANVNAMTATPDLAKVRADLGKCRRLLISGNVPMVGWFWILSPRTETYLRQLADSNGHLVYKAEMDQGKLEGFPYHISTQIPENLGTGTNETEVYLAAAPQHIVYDKMSYEIGVFPGATYVGTGGNLESGLSQDETVVQLISEHDFFQRHSVAAAIITGVTWGA